MYILNVVRIEYQAVDKCVDEPVNLLVDANGWVAPLMRHFSARWSLCISCTYFPLLPHSAVFT